MKSVLHEHLLHDVCISICIIALLYSQPGRTADTTITTCYDTWGTKNTDLIPCGSAEDPSKPVSCCARDDYCLSNGLCLSTSASNLMTQQGCTDNKWGAPCNKMCVVDSANPQQTFNKSIQGRAPDDNGTPEQLLVARDHPDDRGIALIPCVDSWNGQGSVRYCCGNEAQACCKSSQWMSVPAGTIVREAVATTTPAALTDATTTAGPTTASTTAITPPPTSASDTSSRDAMRVGAGVGLGVGIPILIVLVAMAVILARHYKRSSRLQQRPITPFRIVDTDSSTGGSIRRRASNHTSRSRNNGGGGGGDWPPPGLEWGSPSTLSGPVLSPPVLMPLPTPIAEMDAGRMTPKKFKFELPDLPVGAKLNKSTHFED
ncbi:hypothetical protein B0H66DRAFT_381151 [Apodospora peruviana]|uniref:Mid2 domain-containing protein n=1 Tax=Apodospora peruviana TaxID=516989 RepID=A0AAE0LYR0_9PEZI|nr:hypothetical protein B0H66DRAFT_381151 [Apodospora peruviana]